MKKNNYDHNEIEQKWIKFWEKNKFFYDQLKKNKDVNKENKKYLLFAFAYPSGSGLHVGHVESKTALDILARFYRMNAKKVFFPVGWDAFGLPAENYAIKTGVHPAITTYNAINTFKKQIKRLGISYDWENEAATSDPEFYKWTQWIFLQLYKHGFAYKKKGKVNWCPSCKTVLANEQVIDGKCERCDSQVIQKDLTQWFFKITEYSDELLEGLKYVDWPSATKQHQKNWIGKKYGVEIDYKVDGLDKTITCFTTYPHTMFGSSFIVLAPEHSFVKDILDKKIKVSDEVYKSVKDYYDASMKKTELERQKEGKTKTGVFTGFYVNDPFIQGKKLPIWISDFVLSNVGTGAVVGVPAHDVRDFYFAKTFSLPIKRVMKKKNSDETDIQTEKDVYTGDKNGVMINSDFLDGLSINEAKEKIKQYIINNGFGREKTTYKLRDWLISRQRYWGTPIPIVYDPEGNPHPVKEEHLPWLLPEDVDFKPTGESPLKSSKEFIERTERLYGKGWRPEYDTMDTFVDSSWYFIRFLGVHRDDYFSDKENLDKWMPVDLYLIGPEHIVLHLLYSRFFTKFLRDNGYLNLKTGEPFSKMRHQGMILGPDGKKMSKSKGNVINPDDIVEKYGADTLRVYEMFMGPLEADKPWNDRAVMGVRRFLDKVYALVLYYLQDEGNKDCPQDKKYNIKVLLNRLIKKVTSDIEALKFNTAIASMMEFINELQLLKVENINLSTCLTKDEVLSFIKLLHPFAPFITEELAHRLITDKKEDWTLDFEKWPSFDDKLNQISKVPVVFQVNGKTRAVKQLELNEAQDKEKLKQIAEQDPKINKWLKDKDLVKVIFVPGKVINFVVK